MARTTRLPPRQLPYPGNAQTVFAVGGIFHLADQFSDLTLKNMGNIIITCCALPLFFISFAEAGINGIYKIRGTEINQGEKLTFSGTVQVSQSKVGKY